VYEDVRPTTERGEAFTTMLATLDDLTAEAARAGVPVAALAVGVPAILDPETGIGLAGPSVAWEAFDIMSELARRVAVPYVVENDVNLAALAEAWRGDGRRIPDFFTLYLGAGVGGAVVANGSLVKGRHNGAGEIGYVLAGVELAGAGPGGTVGRFEDVAGEAGLLARARALADADGHRRAAVESVADLFAAAGAGDPVATRVVDELLEHVAMALVAVGAIVDPELVILDGPVGRSLASYVPTLVATLERRLPRAPRVVVSRLQGDSTLVGAVAAALELARRRAAPAALFGAFSTSGAPMG
jgi:glucokinase